MPAVHHGIAVAERLRDTACMYDRPTPDWRKLVARRLAELHGEEPSLREVLAANRLKPSSYRPRSLTANKPAETPLKIVPGSTSGA